MSENRKKEDLRCNDHCQGHSLSADILSSRLVASWRTGYRSVLVVEKIAIIVSPGEGETTFYIILVYSKTIKFLARLYILFSWQHRSKG